MFISVVDLSTFMQNKYFLAPKGAAMLVRSGFTNQEQKNVTDLILLAHIPALFMTSPTQTAGHKMAALTIVFSQLENVDVLRNRTRSEELPYVLLISFLSIGPVVFFVLLGSPLIGRCKTRYPRNRTIQNRVSLFHSTTQNKVPP